jgi:predicted DNA-binding ribbon-helix-helix protein
VISGQNNNSLSVVDNSLAEIDSSAIALEISKSLEEVFFTKLNDIISQSNKDSISIIEELRDEIIELKQEINSKERDVLICENAKLKMNLKEKTYEVIELREKIRRYEENQVGFFKRLFGISNVK